MVILNNHPFFDEVNTNYKRVIASTYIVALPLIVYVSAIFLPVRSPVPEVVLVVVIFVVGTVMLPELSTVAVTATPELPKLLIIIDLAGSDEDLVIVQENEGGFAAPSLVSVTEYVPRYLSA